MSQWLPARIRISYYQTTSAESYTRARQQRNAKHPVMNRIFAASAASNAAKGRAALFDLIDRKLPADYDGELKLD